MNTKPSAIQAAAIDYGRPVAGWRLSLYTIIFEADTRAGRDLRPGADRLHPGQRRGGDAGQHGCGACAPRGNAVRVLEWGFTLAVHRRVHRTPGLRAPPRSATRAAPSASSTCWRCCRPTSPCWCRGSMR
ncbi:MAG: hypothetical protein V9G29_15125 [Burkholderiaceae bacterium]